MLSRSVANSAAGGNFSFAAGRKAKANRPNPDFAFTGADQFLIRAAGATASAPTTFTARCMCREWSQRTIST